MVIEAGDQLVLLRGAQPQTIAQRLEPGNQIVLGLALLAKRHHLDAARVLLIAQCLRPTLDRAQVALQPIATGGQRRNLNPERRELSQELVALGEQRVERRARSEALRSRIACAAMKPASNSTSNSTSNCKPPSANRSIHHDPGRTLTWVGSVKSSGVDENKTSSAL